jgi:predicted ribosome quality control (RQC) complex YloA/Tae2 family protein
MKQLSFVDLNYLIKEFDVLINQRIDNFYYENEIFYIRVYVRGGGHKYLTTKVSSYIYLGDSKEDSSHPSSFIQYLRKYLRGSFIREISQIPNERIIKIIFEQKNQEILEKYQLYLEVFANGNIILTNKDNIIKNALSKKKYKDRKVMVRDSYELPPAKDLTLNNIDLKKFKDELKSSDLSLVKFIAIKFGIGGKYAEEICFNLKIDKNIDASKFEKVEALKVELEKLLSKKVDAHFLGDLKNIEDFYPFKFKSVENLSKAESFNQIISNYYSTLVPKTNNSNKLFEKEKKKLQNILDKQEKMLEEINKSSQEQSDIGNRIYENYAFIEELLETINKISKEKGWDYVENKIKENEELSNKIKKLNYKNNEIILNLDKVV